MRLVLCIYVLLFCWPCSIQELMQLLAPAFLVLAALAIAIGCLWSRQGDATELKPSTILEAKNPLEISAALLFAVLFVAMLVATHVAIKYLGQSGVYTLASVMGVADVDPFIMGIAQAGTALTPLHVAASSILVAAASNNVVKGFYAYTLSSKRAGIQSLLFLVCLAVCGLIPMLMLG